MESVLHPSSLHFFTEIYPNKTLSLFFGKQAPDSTPIKNISVMTRQEEQDKRKQLKQLRRQTSPAPSMTDDYDYDYDYDYQDKDLLSKRYQRWSWTASSTVLPMETIQEEEEL